MASIATGKHRQTLNRQLSGGLCNDAMRWLLHRWIALQAQNQKVAKINELASLRTELKHERAENMVLRERLCEICLQLDEMATAKEAGEEEHSMTEQVHVVPHLLQCF